MNLQEYSSYVKGFAQSSLTKEQLISNFALGLSGESGEVVDLIKKYLYHGDDLCQEKLIEEMGDLFWYWIALSQQFNLDPCEIMQQNIDKLLERHQGTTFNREVQRRSKAKELD